MGSQSGSVVVTLIVAVGVFLVIRAVILWYFRLDQIADNLAVIARYCRNIEAETKSGGGVMMTTTAPQRPSGLQGITFSSGSENVGQKQNPFAPK